MLLLLAINLLYLSSVIYIINKIIDMHAIVLLIFMPLSIRMRNFS